MLLGQNAYRTVEKEYKKEHTYTARARLEERFLLCFFESHFLNTNEKVKICTSRGALSVIMQLYEIVEYRQILTVNLTNEYRSRLISCRLKIYYYLTDIRTFRDIAFLPKKGKA